MTTWVLLEEGKGKMLGGKNFMGASIAESMDDWGLCNRVTGRWLAKHRLYLLISYAWQDFGIENLV